MVLENTFNFLTGSCNFGLPSCAPDGITLGYFVQYENLGAIILTRSYFLYLQSFFICNTSSLNKNLGCS